MSTTKRGFYAQSDYRVSHYLTALGGFQYEGETGKSTYSSGSRTNYSGTVQFSGDAASRLFYVLGTGIESNQIYGRAITPRASLAYYAFRPDTTHFLSGTKLHASFGKGIEEPSIGEVVSSLYGTLTPAQNAQYNIHPLAGQYSRTYDMGVEQQFGNGRARVNLLPGSTTSLHQRHRALPPPTTSSCSRRPAGVYTNPNLFGAYVNSLAYRAEGAELESEFRLAPASSSPAPATPTSTPGSSASPPTPSAPTSTPPSTSPLSPSATTARSTEPVPSAALPLRLLAIRN